ncbi:MAG: hypothetical protein KAT05_03245 [Spirochaetes bacterium]|nr:hypothetical protein [Spirochaetota bacterium]
MIADQSPFADDRKWSIELRGLMFFVFHVVIPVVGVLIFIQADFNLFRFTVNDWVLLVIIGIVFLSSIFTEKKVNNFFFKDETVTSSRNFNLYVRGFSIFTIIIIYLIIKYYNWGEYLYIVPALGLLLVYLSEFALFLSLKNGNILKANIYFINSKNKPIKNCRIIKVNDDNIRIKNGDFIMIINKSQILKIEEKIRFDENKNLFSASRCYYKKKKSFESNKKSENPPIKKEQ